MPRLVTVSITAIVDGADPEDIADAIMNSVHVEAIEDAFECSLTLLESEVTLNVEAEE